MDTLHLFNETLEFLEDCERRYDFQALRYLPKGCENKKDWNEKYTSDLYLTDGEKYDEHAKVEPLVSPEPFAGRDCHPDPICVESRAPLGRRIPLSSSPSRPRD